jgi:dihydrodipicolinate synthase/N-acetylneuraminate lyase
MVRRVDWNGFFPAVVTPFDREGNFDQDALREMLRILMDDGVSGVVMLGDNGEWWALTEDEKKTVFDIAVKECRGKVTVIGTTTGLQSEKKTIELTQYAKDIGMDGVMLHAPLINAGLTKLTEREILDFYKRISKVGIPMLIYNIPRKIPVDMDVNFMKKLADEIENFVAVKEADRNIWHLTDKLRLLGDEIAFFIGPCTLIWPGLSMRAVGYIASSPEFFGRQCEDIIKFVKNKEVEKAVEFHFRLCESYKMVTDLTLGPFRAVHKYALNLVGKPAGYPARPVEPLTEKAKKAIKNKMTELGFL